MYGEDNGDSHKDSLPVGDGEDDIYSKALLVYSLHLFCLRGWFVEIP